MKIGVVGTGYVGLVTGTCFAEMGNDVVCVDIDENKVAKMKAGVLPIYEPDLQVLFDRNIKESRLTFTTDLKIGIKEAEIVFFALPTPPGQDGSADLSYVLDVSKKISKLIDKYTVIVNKSTVPVGTAEKVREEISKGTKSKFDVVSNPEFLREGFAVGDFMKPDRVVVGSSSQKAKALMKELYLPFVDDEEKIIFMDERSSEMTKYAANSFLATKITFMNEIANLCEKVGANIDNIRLGIGSDERIGKRFLLPGIGYGGSCFPKDVKALQKIANQNDYSLEILDSVTSVNEHQKNILVNKLLNYFKGTVSGKKFALWGLAFKPDTDDIREAPSLTIINNVTKLKAHVNCYDPEAIDNVKKIMQDNDDISFYDDMYESLKGCDALLIATEWSEFHSPDFKKMKSLLRKPVIFDGRNVYNLDVMEKEGFHYESVGRTVIN